MSTYTMKHVLVDVGFVDGYLHEPDNLPNDWGMFDSALDAIDRISKYAIDHLLSEAQPRDGYGIFLHDVGFLRGLLWKHPLSAAASDAMNRVIGFVTDSDF